MPDGSFVSTSQPDRPQPPVSTSAMSDVPPALIMPPVPTNELRPLIDTDDADQLVEAIAAGIFSRSNPEFYEWEQQRSGAEARRAALARQSARVALLQHQTSFLKTVPVDKETKFRSVYTNLVQIALCIVSIATLASALNVAAAYVVEAAAWPSLVEQPWMAFLFVLVAPAGGLAGIFLISQTLESDLARKRLEQTVAALVLITWSGWLIELGRLYGLQSLIGDSGGRGLPANVLAQVRDLHTWLLILQVTAEVLSGAAFKLLCARVHWRNLKVVVIPSPALAYLETKFDAICDAESQAAGFVGQIDDYQSNYGKALAGFSVACQAELRRLKNGARAVEAEARAKFLAAGNEPAA